MKACWEAKVKGMSPVSAHLLISNSFKGVLGPSVVFSAVGSLFTFTPRILTLIALKDRNLKTKLVGVAAYRYPRRLVTVTRRRIFRCEVSSQSCTEIARRAKAARRRRHRPARRPAPRAAATPARRPRVRGGRRPGAGCRQRLCVHPQAARPLRPSDPRPRCSPSPLRRDRTARDSAATAAARQRHGGDTVKGFLVPRLADGTYVLAKCARAPGQRAHRRHAARRGRGGRPRHLRALGRVLPKSAASSRPSPTAVSTRVLPRFSLVCIRPTSARGRAPRGRAQDGDCGPRRRRRGGARRRLLLASGKAADLELLAPFVGDGSLACRSTR